MRHSANNEALRRGRHRQLRTTALARGLWKALVPAALLLLALLLIRVIEARGGRERPPLSVAQGQAVTETDFAARRSYIRYRVAGNGRRYWYGTIAERFRVAGGWESVARATLLGEGKEAGAADLRRAQHRLEAGQEVRIPISHAR